MTTGRSPQTGGPYTTPAPRETKQRHTHAELIALMSKAHACMRACGWHLAPATDDGILALAVAEIEEEFAEILK